MVGFFGNNNAKDGGDKAESPKEGDRPNNATRTNQVSETGNKLISNQRGLEAQGFSVTNLDVSAIRQANAARSSGAAFELLDGDHVIANSKKQQAKEPTTDQAPARQEKSANPDTMPRAKPDVVSAWDALMAKAIETEAKGQTKELPPPTAINTGQISNLAERFKDSFGPYNEALKDCRPEDRQIIKNMVADKLAGKFGESQQQPERKSIFDTGTISARAVQTEQLKIYEEALKNTTDPDTRTQLKEQAAALYRMLNPSSVQDEHDRSAGVGAAEPQAESPRLASMSGLPQPWGEQAKTGQTDHPQQRVSAHSVQSVETHARQQKATPLHGRVEYRDYGPMGNPGGQGKPEHEPDEHNQPGPDGGEKELPSCGTGQIEKEKQKREQHLGPAPCGTSAIGEPGDKEPDHRPDSNTEPVGCGTSSNKPGALPGEEDPGSRPEGGKPPTTGPGPIGIGKPSEEDKEKPTGGEQGIMGAAGPPPPPPGGNGERQQEPPEDYDPEYGTVQNWFDSNAVVIRPDLQKPLTDGDNESSKPSADAGQPVDDKTQEVSTDPKEVFKDPEKGTPLVNDGGLSAHEKLDGGHTIEKHVGQTNQQLIDRVKAENRNASTFPDRATAERSCAEAVDAKQDEIEEFLKSNKNQRKLEFNCSFETGTLVPKDTLTPERVKGVRIILRRTPQLPGGYRVHTAYPIREIKL
jgi:Bacterial CdiA-CT RNAse A domain